MRTNAEINIEYSELAKVYGDAIFKASQLQNVIKELHDKLAQLSQEMKSSKENVADPKVGEN